MNYLLDTNIVSHIIRGDIPEINEKIKSIESHKLSVSVITSAEIYFGLSKKGNPPELKRLVDVFFDHIEVHPFYILEAMKYGNLRTACQAVGVTVESMDLLIAAHALALQEQRTKYVLVTRDKIFSKIPAEVGLLYERW